VNSGGINVKGCIYCYELQLAVTCGGVLVRYAPVLVLFVLLCFGNVLVLCSRAGSVYFSDPALGTCRHRA